MPRRKRSMWSQTRRDLYVTQSAMGDVSAARNGRLGRRLVRRSVTRTGFGILRAFVRGMR